MISSEEYEWMMKYLFGSSIKYAIYLPICLFGSFCIYDTETIHHTMYMRIDSDIWHIVEYGEDDFCSLDPYAWEGLDQFQIIWDISSILYGEYRPCFFYIPGFVAKKVHIFQMFFDIL